MAQTIEREFLGGSKARRWNYLILGTLLLLGMWAGQAAWEHPDEARTVLEGLIGLPAWAMVSLVSGLGAMMFYLGLKIEADWPEALGAALIAGAFLAVEILFGLQHFVFGGITLTPYVLPLLVFAALFGVGLARSR